MNLPGCECVAELMPSADDCAYCSKCGKEYVRSQSVRYAPEHGPDAVEVRIRTWPAEGVRLVRVDDDQKPETD